MADRERGMTFGYTVPYGKVASSWPDKNIGLRGGVRVRSGESVCELIAASDCAYWAASGDQRRRLSRLMGRNDPGNWPQPPAIKP